MRAYWRRVAGVSVCVAVPCFWHARIEAGDLGSHVYNAWIAQLIPKGEAPGLYLVSLWHNVLFDWLLAGAVAVLGFSAGQKAVVAFTVLALFWGAFALVSRLGGRAAWFLTPCLAMLAYGYCFNMGFFNYCLSVGLGCWSLAIFLGGERGDKIAALFFLPAVYLAHPVGFLFVVGVMGYLTAKDWLRGWWKAVVPAAAVAAIYTVRWILLTRENMDVDWSKAGPFYTLNGSDQLVLYGVQYSAVALAGVLFGVLCVTLDFILRRREGWGSYRGFALAAELYAVTFVATALLPENVRASAENGWMGLLVSRLTMISAIFGLGVLAGMKPRKWQLAGFLAVALGFFVLLYKDTGYLNRIEASAEALLWRLPYGARILTDLSTLPDSRIEFVGHSAERACVGHCFAYLNYEPPSRQFRVRAEAGGKLGVPSYDVFEEMVKPTHVFEAKDMPLTLLYQCDESDGTKLCLREMKAGETTGGAEEGSDLQTGQVGE